MLSSCKKIFKRWMKPKQVLDILAIILITIDSKSDQCSWNQDGILQRSHKNMCGWIQPSSCEWKSVMWNIMRYCVDTRREGKSVILYLAIGCVWLQTLYLYQWITSFTLMHCAVSNIKVTCWSFWQQTELFIMFCGFCV